MSEPLPTGTRKPRVADRTLSGRRRRPSSEEPADQTGSERVQGGKVLIIDDEPVVMDVLRGVLGGQGLKLEFAEDATQGKALLTRRSGWDAVLLDIMLPDADGLEVLRWIRERHPEIAVVMITAHGSVESAVQAMRDGAFHYLTKPFKNDEVRAMVAQALQTTRLRQENRQLKQALRQREQFEKIIGKSKPMQDVYRFVEQVASSRANVLIQGESGTGKELVAQAIHRRSHRASKPFIVVNSSSIPTELLEDNLFGHVRGAFTGANADRLGLLEAAEGGTIVFDEITSVAPVVQVKLLRVIQEKECTPLGTTESRNVDVRIIAATNESVKELVDQGSFRDDLYYRLNVISITLPPLRRRIGDLPLLLAHFLRRYNRENGKQVETVDPQVMERLSNYGWPGNVRELENVIERGVVLALGDSIGLDLLPAELMEKATLLRSAQLDDGVDFNDAVSRYERQLIEEALRRSGGIQKQAAAMLGLKPTTLNEKIKRLRDRD